MSKDGGKPLTLNSNAKSASPDLPAFLARPAGAPVYHGFRMIEESRTDGWVFGTISAYEGPHSFLPELRRRHAVANSAAP